MQGILGKYRDGEIDLADACLIYLAQEFETGRILTLDQDFAIYKWSKSRHFELLVSLK